MQPIINIYLGSADDPSFKKVWSNEKHEFKNTLGPHNTSEVLKYFCFLQIEMISLRGSKWPADRLFYNPFISCAVKMQALFHYNQPLYLYHIIYCLFVIRLSDKDFKG